MSETRRPGESENGPRKVRVGFTDSRSGVLAALYRMGAASCAYSGLDEWADRCDCKYGVTGARRWPTIGERGNGCPELRSLYGVIAAMDDDEWYRLVMRAGGTPRGAVLNGDDIGQRLHRADAAASMAAAEIAKVRAALGGSDV